MTPQRQKSQVTSHKASKGVLPWAAWPLCVLALSLGTPAPGPSAEPDLPTLCADRATIERVYYSHRTGTKPPFEETLPADALRRLVQTDLAKEAALKNVYGVGVTPAMLAAEVQRINTTTRAPEVLAELKAALGNETNRFARTVARPIVVERLLRNRFENDDALHAPRRREAERVREQLLRTVAADVSRRTNNPAPDQRRLTSAATNGLVEKLVAILKNSHSNAVTETTWQLGARPAEAQPPSADELEIKKRFGPEAKILSAPPSAGREAKQYFGDLPGELQRVLRVQLRQAGDVSAVIETPGGFMLYVCQEKTAATLSVAILSLPKRSYEEWLTEQEGGRR
jgi:hypothetical protein